MAKSKATGQEQISLVFLRTGNSWIDAGVVGLYRVLMGFSTYVKVVPGSDSPLPGSADFSGVAAELRQDRLVVAGPFQQVQACLEKAYDRLIACYFDISSQKQIDDTQSYNFYFERATECFHKFPKKKPAGAALLLFDKAVRPAGEQEKWGIDATTGKATPGRLPASLGHLQAKLDRFLAENRLKPGPPAGLLIDAGNEVRPKMEFKVQAKQGPTPCFLTGKPQPGSAEAKNTAFPLFGGSRSFINNTNENLRIGWQLDFVGKFVPAVAFFYQQGDDLHLFFPEAHDLRRLDYITTVLQPMVSLEPNLFRNFDLHLGGYFQGRSEVALAFLHRVFEKLSEQIKVQEAATPPLLEEEESASLYDDPDAAPDTPQAEPTPEADISSEAVYDAILRGGAVAFTIVSATKKGNVWMARDFWTFHDLVYLSRLFEKMLQKEELPSGRVKVRCRPRALMNALIDFDAKKDKTVLRDRICESILHKRSVLPLLERHAYHIFTQSEPSRPRKVGPLLDFAVLYEIERYEGTAMKKEDYEKMVQRATWLGNNIADGVASAMHDAERKESAGRAKGAFFRLRKTRTTADFLDELARLQNRYPKINLPPEALEANIFNHATFEEFRGFCVVAALSRFQWKAQPQANR
jgi:hypothetical protein